MATLLLTATLPKPVLRGRFHQLGGVISVPAGLVLVASAASPVARLTAAIFAFTWTAMFATSASYHRLARSPRACRLLRRADHSMIFVHIAGAATPLCVLAVPAPLRWLLLGLVWLGAAAGVAAKVTRLSATDATRSAGTWLYLPLGWALAVALPYLAAVLGWATLLILAAGVAYSVGAACFFRHRPDPLPAVFGYHEVWHCFTLVGGVCQFLAVHALVSVPA
jgi:hemolysin III